MEVGAGSIHREKKYLPRSSGVVPKGRKKQSEGAYKKILLGKKGKELNLSKKGGRREMKS